MLNSESQAHMTAPPPTARVGDPELLAQRFHEAYERLAPSFGYETRQASAKPWADVPENNRRLMVAVCAEILASSPPNAPTAAERAGEDEETPIRRAIAELLRVSLSSTASEERRHAIDKIVDLHIDAIDERDAALLAARRERETAYETTAQVRDALSEEILKLRDHLAAARRENETGAIPLSADEINALRYCVKKAEHCVRMHATSATYAAVMGTLARAYDVLNRAALAAAHGED